MGRFWGLLILIATLPLLAFNRAVETAPLVSLGKGTLSEVIWSPDGSTLAVSGSNGIYLYAAGNLDELRHIQTGALMTSIAYSPDGARLATGGSLGDNSIIVWDTFSREIAYQFPEQTRSVKSLVFGPDDILISGDGRGTIRVWDLNTGQLIQTLESHTCAVNALAINPADGTLASGSCDKSVLFWDLATGNALGRTGGLTAPITHLSFDAAGNQLLASDDEGHLWLVAAATGGNTPIGQTDQPEIQFLQANPGGGFWLASGGASGILDVWQIQQE